MTTPIQASALRIGMFVHLNVGWMSHPFPLSSFKLTSSEQIETIRSLGLTRLTWSPERAPYHLETSVPGVFVAGDARAESAKRVASAVGEGAMAVMLVHRYMAKQ